MKEIEAYIEQLLIRTDCVIVPDLGGFVVQHQSAKIIGERILPPQATVGFNPQLIHTDGLLANEYARQNDLTYREAAEEITRQITALKQTLQTENSISIGGIGTLHRNANGSLDFSPATATFLPDNLGLQPLYLSPQTEKPVQLTVTLPSRSRFFRYAAACAIGIVFWCMAPHTEEPDYSDYAGLNPINWANILSEREAAKVDTVASIPAECDETIQLLQEKRHKYHIIVAALDKQAAQCYCNQLIENGFPCAHILPYKNGLYRIATQSFRSKREAIDQMEQLRTENPEHKRAWVYCE